MRGQISRQYQRNFSTRIRVWTGTSLLLIFTLSSKLQAQSNDSSNGDLSSASSHVSLNSLQKWGELPVAEFLRKTSPRYQEPFEVADEKKEVTEDQEEELPVTPLSSILLEDETDEDMLAEQHRNSDQNFDENDTRSKLSIKVSPNHKNSFDILIKPNVLTFQKEGELISLSIEGVDSQDSLSIFVRDPSILKWSPANQSFTALKAGSTEIYVHLRDTLQILPATVGLGSTLTEPKPIKLAAIPLEEEDKSDKANDEEQEQGSTGKPIDLLIQKKPVLLSEKDERSGENSGDNGEHVKGDHVERMPRSKQAGESVDLALTSKSASYPHLQIQVIDDRSTPGRDIYPVSGVSVSFVGTGISAITDNRGFIQTDSIPSQSKILVRVEDPQGHFQPSIAEISSSPLSNSTGNDSDQVPLQHVKVMRTFTYEHLLELAGVSGEASGASLCGLVYEKPGIPFKDGNISILGGGSSGDEASALYFNSTGFLDPSQTKTGNSGRFCFFNLQEGALVLRFTDAKGKSTSVPFVVYEGVVQERTFDLSGFNELRSQAVLRANVSERESGESLSRKLLVDEPDLTLLLVGGSSMTFKQTEESSFSGKAPRVEKNSASYYLSEGPELESSIYQLRVQEEQVSSTPTPIFPRGFIENMSVYTHSVQEPSRGSVLVEHGLWNNLVHNKAGQGTEADLKIGLFDPYGKEVYLPDQYSYPQTKKFDSTLFLNVPPGLYSVVVEDQEGNIHAMDTVLVYSETLSYINTGNTFQVLDK